MDEPPHANRIDEVVWGILDRLWYKLDSRKELKNNYGKRNFFLDKVGECSVL